MVLADRRPRPARRPGRPRGGGLVADRAQLLAAAERLIRSQGPGVTMEAVAAEAAVTTPILYRTVGDKDALAEALAEVLVDRVNAAVTAAVVGAADEREGFRRFVAAYFGQVEAHRDLYLFVTGGATGDDGLTRALRLADRSAVPLAARLAEQRAAAGLDPAAARVWAYGVIGALHFVTLSWLRDAAGGPDETARHITELLWSGLAPAGSTERTIRAR